jgi:hypothetical protein
MAATMEIRSYHGATPDSGTDVAGGAVRFKQADNDTVDANNPIPIPGAGTNYSFVKQFRFYAATTPDNTINNLKFYTDGANGYGTGVDLDVQTQTGYIDPISLGASLMGSGTDAFAYTSGSALSVTGSINNPTTGAFGDYVQLQMKADNTAGQGTTATEQVTFQYDES